MLLCCAQISNKVCVLVLVVHLFCHRNRRRVTNNTHGGVNTHTHTHTTWLSAQHTHSNTTPNTPFQGKPNQSFDRQSPKQGSLHCIKFMVFITNDTSLHFHHTTHPSSLLYTDTFSNYSVTSITHGLNESQLNLPSQIKVQRASDSC